MVNLLLNVVSRILFSTADTVWHTLTLTYIFTWDTTLVLLNTISFPKRKGKLIAPGKLGHGGNWPEWHPPVEGDSRSPCPALNAMANHGILPRDGKNIPFTVLNRKIRETYNFSPTFCLYVPLYMARLLGRSYTYGTLDLNDIAVHNGIEHDASLFRHDTFLSPGGDQGKPCPDLVDGFFDCVHGDKVTVDDLARYSEIRRTDSRRKNGQFTLSTFHKLFASSNCATLIRIMGGSISDLKVWLYEERLPPNYESSTRAPWGLTMGSFQTTVLRIEAAIRAKESMDSTIGDLGGRYGLPKSELGPGGEVQREAQMGETAPLLPGKKPQTNGE
ncbi:heme-thiolate peroxidase [Dacryopinax primogenitus]|uniref:Heme-thiolate peroxidase n=1 Tax=Dacryopinax primogenitus (strain DJM 731) TaxID=1858805 RepID=M5FX63_DACPD|nr:heme-thiolate peroxidase [Dacryopinax primogenitus]EJU01024.1 heme-thiolate peroxidase [Dacryopinax primogenitus]